MATAEDIRKLGRRSVALHCDLTDEEAVNRLLQRVEDSLGRPSCLVNNASVFEHDSVTDFSAHSLDFHMRTNLTAPVLLSRALHTMTPEDRNPSLSICLTRNWTISIPVSCPTHYRKRP